MTFDQILIGKSFKTRTNNIVYKKVSNKEARVLKDNNGNRINNGKLTTAFYNSKLEIDIVV